MKDPGRWYQYRRRFNL